MEIKGGKQWNELLLALTGQRRNKGEKTKGKKIVFANTQCKVAMKSLKTREIAKEKTSPLKYPNFNCLITFMSAIVN